MNSENLLFKSFKVYSIFYFHLGRVPRRASLVSLLYVLGQTMEQSNGFPSNYFPKKSEKIWNNSEKIWKILKVLVERYATFHTNFRKLKGIGFKILKNSESFCQKVCNFSQQLL